MKFSYYFQTNSLTLGILMSPQGFFIWKIVSIYRFFLQNYKNQYHGLYVVALFIFLIDLESLRHHLPAFELISNIKQLLFLVFDILHHLQVLSYTCLLVWHSLLLSWYLPTESPFYLLHTEIHGHIQLSFLKRSLLNILVCSFNLIYCYLQTCHSLNSQEKHHHVVCISLIYIFCVHPILMSMMVSSVVCFRCKGLRRHCRSIWLLVLGCCCRSSM